MLREPPATPYDWRFRLGDIPVRVHPLFWLVALLLGLGGSNDAWPMILWVAAVFVSILVHELGHALAARSYGWRPWITLHAFGGLASYRPTYRDPKAQILITLSGPGAGFLLAGLIVALIAATGHRPTFAWPEFILPVRFEPYRAENLNLLLYDLLYVNIFWGLVNLLPIVPLDGGQISQELFQLAQGQDGVRQALWLSVFVAAGVAVLALLRLESYFLAFFFGYMAYTSYMLLQAYFGPGGGWGGSR